MDAEWSLSEPNMASALKKNKNAICAMHDCKNKLGDPPSYGFGGVKICNECGERRDEMVRRLHEDTTRDSDTLAISTIQI